MFNSRWLLAPFYVGLVIAVGLLLIKFAQELIHLIEHVFTVTLIASIVAISAIELLKSSVNVAARDNRELMWKVASTRR
ncbi:MAG TPA: YqhA family protein [Burkholderiales bacterium]